jgi:hypothetical protein
MSPHLHRVKLYISIVFVFTQLLNANSQYFFEVKKEGCSLDGMRLASFDEEPRVFKQVFTPVIEHLKAQFSFAGKKGEYYYQVVIDENLNCCVVSHTDLHTSKLAVAIIHELESYKDWVPYWEGNKSIKYTLAIHFEIANGQISAKVVEVEMNTPSSNEGDAKLALTGFNKLYKHNNETLKQYFFRSWKSSSAGFFDTRVKEVTEDTSGGLWIVSQRDSYYFKNGKFFQDEEVLPTNFCEIPFKHVTCDNAGNVWLANKESVIKVSTDNSVTLTKTLNPGVSLRDIAFQKNTNELLVSTYEGLWIGKGNEWTKLSRNSNSKFPCDSVDFAFRDSKKRLWIGTDKGTYLLSDSGVPENLNAIDTLRNFTVQGICEDGFGNIYFALNNPKQRGKKSIEISGGLGVFSADGKWTILNSENSGLPQNKILSMQYDQEEKLLWLICETDGLVRYDLKASWENYNFTNCDVPMWGLNSIVSSNLGGFFVGGKGHLVYFQKNN